MTRTSRRNFSTLALPVLALLGLAACAEPGEAPGAALPDAAGDFCETALARVDAFISEAEAAWSPPSSPERYGGTAVVSGSADLGGGLNALVSDDYAAAQHQNHVALMTLVTYDEELRPRPYLAESWELASDSMAVTFRLRDDVFWHDGRRTTAHDVAFTFHRMTHPETGYSNAAFWDSYVKGAEGVEVVDSSTVTLRWTRYDPEFLDPWRTVGIMPAHLLADVPPAELGRHPFGQSCPVGNGPFVFVEHRSGESWAFRANPTFPEGLGGRPYLDRLVYRVVSEPATALTELLTGRTDVYIQPPASQAAEIERAEGVELRAYPFRQFTFVLWNARREQLADPRVRRALTRATHRQEIVDALLRGYAQVAQTTVPPFHWAYDERLAGTLPYDTAAAARLLEQAGWIDRDGDGVRENAAGTPLSVEIVYNEGNQTRQNIAELMQAQLRRVGVEARPRVLNYQVMVDRLTSPDRDFDGAVMGFVSEFKLDDRDLFHSERIDGPYAMTGTANPRLDALMDSLALASDRPRAERLLRDYQEALIEEQPATFLYFNQQLDGVSERLQDVETDVRGEWINAREWWIRPEDRRSRR